MQDFLNNEYFLEKTLFEIKQKFELAEPAEKCLVRVAGNK